MTKAHARHLLQALADHLAPHVEDADPGEHLHVILWTVPIRPPVRLTPFGFRQQVYHEDPADHPPPPARPDPF